MKLAHEWARFGFWGKAYWRDRSDDVDRVQHQLEEALRGGRLKGWGISDATGSQPVVIPAFHWENLYWFTDQQLPGARSADGRLQWNDVRIDREELKKWQKSAVRLVGVGRARGRPSPRPDYEPEVRRRYSSGQRCQTAREEARFVQKWLIATKPSVSPPTFETAEKAVGKIWRDMGWVSGK